MPSPCPQDGSMYPTCAPGNQVEIAISDLPDSFVNDGNGAPPGFTKLHYAVLLAFDAHPSRLSVPMPGGWSEEVDVGATEAYPLGPVDENGNPTRFVVTCDAAGVAVNMGYPRPAMELALLWAGSLTTVALPGNETCTSTVVGPYPPPAVDEEAT